MLILTFHSVITRIGLLEILFGLWVDNRLSINTGNFIER